MKSSIVMAVVVGLLATTGCTVRCHTERVEEGKGKPVVLSECEGFVEGCNPITRSNSDCKPFMRIECNENDVYRGPYTVDRTDKYIKYIAADWNGPDAPFIVTKVPTFPPTAEEEDVRGMIGFDHEEQEGSCSYEFKLGR